MWHPTGHTGHVLLDSVWLHFIWLLFSQLAIGWVWVCLAGLGLTTVFETKQANSQPCILTCDTVRTIVCFWHVPVLLCWVHLQIVWMHMPWLKDSFHSVSCHIVCPRFGVWLVGTEVWVLEMALRLVCPLTTVWWGPPIVGTTFDLPENPDMEPNLRYNGSFFANWTTGRST